MSIPEKIKLAPSAERFPVLREGAEKFVAALQHSLEEEVRRIIEQEPMIGEGRTAKIFNVEAPQSPCLVCAKVWRNKPRRELSPAEYRRIQFLAPEEEFELQDELYRKGVKVPRPIAFGRIGDRDVMVMERLRGYDLRQILEGGAKIKEPSWSELTKVWMKLRDARAVHRDLQPQNIFLETEDPLTEGGELSGNLYLIDFGLSRSMHGSSPDAEDFAEEVNGSTIKFPDDRRKLDELNPKTNRYQSPFLQ